MKTFTGMVLALIALNVSAHADGFSCDGDTFATRIEVYNKLKPSEGTRNVSVMVVSDLTQPKGKRTVTTFTKEQGLLIQNGAMFMAMVDHDMHTPVDGAKKMAGTLLRELSVIQVIVDFNYRVNTPSQAGQTYPALATYTTNAGDDIFEKMICTRYKKH